MKEQWEIDLANALAVPPEDEDADSVNHIKEDNERMANQLASVADILAERGIIHNTPTAKLNWIEGR